MNIDELTRDGESCLSVCEWTADTPGCYTPQREKSHLLTGSDRVAPPRLTDGFSSERRFNPRGRNTHTHTHLNAASKTTWKKPNLHGTDRVSESERRSLTFLAFQPNFCDMNPFENVQNRQRRERQVDMLEGKWHFLLANWRKVSVWL